MSAGYLLEYQVRIRNRADSADLLVITSVPAGTNPYIKEPPRGDGASFNPQTADQMAGSYTVLVVDAITSGTDRAVTAKLEDVNGLLQLGYLKTYIESRRDGGAWSVATVGYLTLLRLIDATVWELTVQDALRALEGVKLFNPASTRLITDFLADWPTRGVILGGPILNGFVGDGFPRARDLGGWRMKVRAFGPDSFGVYRYQLTPVNVYGPPDFSPTHGHIADYADGINQGVSTLPNIDENGTTGFTTIQDAQRGCAWAGLILLIDGVPFCPILPYYSAATGNIRNVDPNNRYALISAFEFAASGSIFARLHGQTALTNGATVAVRALTILPTPISPIYVDRHPVDLISDVCALAGIGFTDANGVKALFGDDMREALRITEAWNAYELLKQAAFQLGIGVTKDSTGRVVPFAMRKFSNALPSKTITDSLIVEGSARLPFEQDVGIGGLQQVTFAHKILAQTGGPISFLDRVLGRTVVTDALDGVTERPATFVENNADSGALVSGEETVSLPGMLRVGARVPAPVDGPWVYAFAKEYFDRFGRVPQAMEFDLQRGDATTDADLATLGEEVLVQISQLPNHNKRWGDDNSVGARAMQIVQLTEEPSRRPARLLDSGPAAQPLVTKPTHTIAASAELPRTVAALTITNAATLNGLGYAVEVQVALVDHSGAAPASTAYVTAFTSAPGATPTGAQRLPTATAGAKVYARARSLLAGHRPSDWSTPVSLALSLVDDPTSVAAAGVTGDGTVEDLSWVIGTNASADLTDVYIRPSAAAFAAAQRFATLLAGSTRFRLFGLTPSTSYKASIQHRDGTTGDLSNPVDVSFTTNASLGALTAPTGAVAFSDIGSGQPLDPKQATVWLYTQGHYGLAVVATAFPSLVEFQEAIETGVGTGAYGDYATVAIMPSVSGDFTVFTKLSPNDGLTRKLRARHVLFDLTSGYTYPQIAAPWTYNPLDVAEASVSLEMKWTNSADGLTRTFSLKAGSRVHRIAVFSTVQAVDSASDPWPPANSIPTIPYLVPDPVTGIATYVVTKSSADKQTYVQFEPRLEDWTSGPVQRNIVDAAPSAQTATLKGDVTNDTVDLSASIAAGLADWPVTVDFFADNPLGAALCSTSLSANATLTKASTGLSALGGLTLPLRAARRFYVRLTNVAGEVVWGNPIAVDRDSVPYGYVTVQQMVYTPTIRCTYDDDTDTVVITIPGGHTKTFSGLSGSGEVAYSAGSDAYDGGGVEGAFSFDEKRGRYRVDVSGGGVTTTVWGSAAGATGYLWGPKPLSMVNVTGAVDSNGVYQWTTDGPTGQTAIDHYHYAESTSAFPSIATARAGTLISGGTASRTGGGPLTLGQTVYVTIIPADVFGTELDAIHVRIAYTTTSGSITTRYSPALFHPGDNTTTTASYRAANGVYLPGGHSSANATGTPDKHFAILPVAKDRTLRSVTIGTYCFSTYDQIAFQLLRQDSAGGVTQLGSTQTNTGGGAQDLTVGSLSESATATRVYAAYLETYVDSGGFTLFTPSAWFIEIVQDFPDLTKNL